MARTRSGSGAGTSHTQRTCSFVVILIDLWYNFFSLLDDAIENILDPTETVTARNTGTRSRRMTHLLERHHHCQRVNQEQRSNQSLCCVLLEQHGAPECFRTTAATVAGSTNACHGCWTGMEARLASCDDQSLDSPLDPCQRQSEPPPVSLQEQQVTSSDSLRGQSAMPHVSVPAHLTDSDYEETAFFAAESLVIDKEHR